MREEEYVGTTIKSIDDDSWGKITIELEEGPEIVIETFGGCQCCGDPSFDTSIIYPEDWIYPTEQAIARARIQGKIK